MRIRQEQWMVWALVFVWLLPGKMWADVFLKQKHHVDNGRQSANRHGRGPIRHYSIG